MTRPFSFKIHAAEIFAEVSHLTQKQKADWITQFCTDLLTLNPALSYSKKIIAETNDFIEKQREHGKLGGRPKKGRVKAALRQPKGSPNLKEEIKEVIKEKNKYRDNVLLTEDEYSTLLAKHGNQIVDKILDKLSSYKLANGREYVSDYGAINQWVVEAVIKSFPQQPVCKEYPF